MSQVVSDQVSIYPDLNGRTVFISGGATGIGKGLVEAFARQGCKTAFVDIDVTAGQALEASLKTEGHQVSFIECDITDVEGYQSAIRNVSENYGPISVLLNNAANDVRHSLDSLTSEKFDSLVGVNLKHAMFAIQAVVPMMKKAGGGSIINFGSVSWMMNQSGMPAYTTSKAAVHGMTRGLARELGGHNIRINTLVPGWVMTEKQLTLWVDDEGRELIKKNQCMPGQLLDEHIAAMALFLGSNASAMCTAQDFIVDGGWV